MTDAERRCKAVARLGKTIEELLKKGLADDYVQDLVEKFQEKIDGFKENELTASVEESYMEAIDRFRMAIGNLRLAKANNNNNNRSQQRALPKEKVLEHDGTTSSFFGFWKRAKHSL